MKRRFSQRVDIERRVLTLVNNVFTGLPLVGLSVHALSRWKDGCNQLPEDVYDLVEKISIRAALDVNASRDVFSEGELKLDSPVDIYMDQLEKRLLLI